MHMDDAVGGGGMTVGEGAGVSIRRIEFDVEWPPGHVAAYLLLGEEPVVVDAGMPGEDNVDALTEGVAASGLELADVEHLVLTHPHVDHIGHVEAFLDAGDPTVYAPAPYRETLQRSMDEVEAAVRETVLRAGIPEEKADAAVERDTDRQAYIRSLLPGEEVDVWIADGETVSVGARDLEAVHTPGHQQDHLCLRTFLDGEAVLFSGDMGIRPFRAAAVNANFDAPATEGITAYFQALDRLEDLAADRVLPGHGPAHGDLAGSIANARDSLERLLDTTQAALREDGTHAIHAAYARADDIEDGPYIPEAIGALAHLEREGRAESHVEDGVRYYVPA
jgi:glyoxylase-like metal-dependent hydrolase (beta-lactamase superfamily II)